MPAFQFTPLVRGATTADERRFNGRRFNSRPSCEGRPVVELLLGHAEVSIHAPRARGDQSTEPLLTFRGFQFTPLVRGATSTRRAVMCMVEVSIHAPRARGDRPPASRSPPERFNSRPSCEGRRAIDAPAASVTFQFTPLVRGATESATAAVPGRVSIHAPRARGDASGTWQANCLPFQFTPLVRGATSVCYRSTTNPTFQFTPLVRGATIIP